MSPRVPSDTVMLTNVHTWHAFYSAHLLHLSWCTQWVLLLRSIVFLCYKRPWTAARNAVRGQPGSTILQLPMYDIILARRCLETSATAIGFLSLYPSPQNDLFIWHGHVPSRAETLWQRSARQVMSDQTNDGWLSLHTWSSHSGDF